MELNHTFERERLEQEKAFIKEMFEGYAKLHGLTNEQIAKLLASPSDEPEQKLKAKRASKPRIIKLKENKK